ncbi:hypothetical protein NC651_021648 [Populus alba x Populus x berolinensis]|nr:hypothetical protein NC651_021648 [Populus alba x Populus x berolinensis]
METANCDALTDFLNFFQELALRTSMNIGTSIGTALARKKKKKRSGGLPDDRPFLRELELPVLCYWMVLALVAANGGSSLWWQAMFATVLPVCAEAQACSSSSRVL